MQEREADFHDLAAGADFGTVLGAAAGDHALMPIVDLTTVVGVILAAVGVGDQHR